MKLIRKQYIGHNGYIHAFKNLETGEIKYVPTTQKEYEKMSERGGEKYNPVLEGHVWVGAMGGTIQCDNEDTVLKEGEYVETPTEILAIVREGKFKAVKHLPKDAVENDVLKAEYIKKHDTIR